MRPFRIITLTLLLDPSNARLAVPTRYLNPYHVLNGLAPRRRFLKLINISPRNFRQRTLEQSAPILVVSGKQQMYLRCSAIVFIWSVLNLFIAKSWFVSNIFAMLNFARIAIGTLFYSFYNKWPLSQSFFYAGKYAFIV